MGKDYRMKAQQFIPVHSIRQIEAFIGSIIGQLQP